MPLKLITLIILLSVGLFILPLNIRAATTCDRVRSITGNTEGTTTGVLSIAATIDNCTNTNLNIIAEDPNNANHFLVLAEVMTDANGSFNNRNINIREAGTWNIHILLGPEPIPSNDFTITITSVSGPNNGVLQCGQVVGEDNPSRCPASCLPTQVNGTWLCGDVNSEVKTRCQTDVNPQNLVACTKNASLNPTAECTKEGKTGIVCINSDLILCKTDDDAVRCQTPPTSGGGGTSCDVLNPGDPSNPNPGTGVMTAIGCIPTDPKVLINKLMGFSAGVGGGIALLLMILGAFQMLTSAGNPESIKKGRDQFVAAAVGLVFIIFSATLLRIIGFNILDLPGFGQ